MKDNYEEQENEFDSGFEILTCNNIDEYVLYIDEKEILRGDMEIVVNNYSKIFKKIKHNLLKSNPISYKHIDNKTIIRNYNTQEILSVLSVEYNIKILD